MSRVFKVLSIDGGGIKGIYSAKILEEIEKEFNSSIVEYFDLICGTSTGGLIALALSLKIPVSEMVSLYENFGSLIFNKPKGLKRYYRQLIKGGKYDNEILKNKLKEIFRTSRISDSQCLLCIQSYNLTEGRPFIFKYDHNEGGLRRDNDTLYVDVALATSAAPTFFPVVEIFKYSRATCNIQKTRYYFS